MQFVVRPRYDGQRLMSEEVMITRMMKLHRLCLGFAAALFAASLPAAAHAATAVTTSNVNLREGPSTDYPVIMTLPASAAVDVEGCAQGWCKVDYSGAAGWMSEDYLQGLASPPTIVLPVPIVVPGYHHRPHYGYRPPHHRPPVVVPRPPHRPRPPGIHPPPRPRPPHNRPPGTRPPGGGRPGIHPPPQHRPPGGGRPGGGGPGHRPPPSGGRPGGGGGRPGGGPKTQN
jgi:uncharacterized protein YraI